MLDLGQAHLHDLMTELIRMGIYGQTFWGVSKYQRQSSFDPCEVANSIRGYGKLHGFITPRQAELLKRLGYRTPPGCEVRPWRYTPKEQVDTWLP